MSVVITNDILPAAGISEMVIMLYQQRQLSCRQLL